MNKSKPLAPLVKVDVGDVLDLVVGFKFLRPFVEVCGRELKIESNGTSIGILNMRLVGRKRRLEMMSSGV